MAKILLIVEDDPYVRRFYERLFAQKNYTTEMAENAEEGLEKAKTTNPDLILLDIMMPGKNGLEVLKELKSDPLTKDITVIMLTNIEDQDTVGEATALGAGGFLVKSMIEPEKLLQVVEGYIKE